MVAIAKGPKFTLGQMVATPGALEALSKNRQAPLTFLQLHVQGEWGDLSAGDRKANEDALATDARILSAYKLNDGTRIWVITEADRSSTCILLPEEY